MKRRDFEGGALPRACWAPRYRSAGGSHRSRMGVHLADAFHVARRPKYESLVAWQRADDLFVRLHRISKQRFPADERYELTSQIRRAALSVPANIVEGIARYHHKERLQFLRTASASLDETRYYVHVASRLGYLTEDLYAELVLDIRKVGAPLTGMIRAVRASLASKRILPIAER